MNRRPYEDHEDDRPTFFPTRLQGQAAVAALWTIAIACSYGTVFNAVNQLVQVAAAAHGGH